MFGQALVALNATSAIPRPPPHLTPDERIRHMATFDRMMLEALQMSAATPAQRAARNRAIASARIELAASTNRRLNPTAVRRIDAVLGLPASDPQLGVRGGKPIEVAPAYTGEICANCGVIGQADWGKGLN
jgi:hypothetical protein